MFSSFSNEIASEFFQHTFQHKAVDLLSKDCTPALLLLLLNNLGFAPNSWKERTFGDLCNKLKKEEFKLGFDGDKIWIQARVPCFRISSSLAGEQFVLVETKQTIKDSRGQLREDLYERGTRTRLLDSSVAGFIATNEGILDGGMRELREELGRNFPLTITPEFIGETTAHTFLAAYGNIQAVLQKTYFSLEVPYHSVKNGHVDIEKFEQVSIESEFRWQKAEMAPFKIDTPINR